MRDGSSAAMALSSLVKEYISSLSAYLMLNAVTIRFR